MKTALLLLPKIDENISRQVYLSACIDKIINDGYIPLNPGLFDLCMQMATMEYIENLSPILNAIYLFTDFGMGELMKKVAEKYSIINSKVKIIYYRFETGKLNDFRQNIDNILEEISDKSGIPVAVLKMKTRKREIVEARQIYFKRAYETTRNSLATVGRLVNKEHASVLHGIRTINNVKELTERYNKYFPKLETEQRKKIKPEMKITEPITEPEPVKSETKNPEPIKQETKRFISPYQFLEVGSIQPFSGYREHSR